LGLWRRELREGQHQDLPRSFSDLHINTQQRSHGPTMDHHNQTRSYGDLGRVRRVPQKRCLVYRTSFGEWEENKRQISDLFCGSELNLPTGELCLGLTWPNIPPREPPRNPQEPPGNPQEPTGTPQEKGGRVCYPDSPSLNVALRDVGFTFVGFFQLALTKRCPPGGRIYIFFAYLHLPAFKIESSIRESLQISQSVGNPESWRQSAIRRGPPVGSPGGDPPVG
jgi:hypothetical protein